MNLTIAGFLAIFLLLISISSPAFENIALAEETKKPKSKKMTAREMEEETLKVAIAKKIAIAKEELAKKAPKTKVDSEKAIAVREAAKAFNEKAKADVKAAIAKKINATKAEKENTKLNSTATLEKQKAEERRKAIEKENEKLREKRQRGH